MINVLAEFDGAGVHLPGALDADVLRLEEVVHLAVLFLLYTRERVRGLSTGDHLITGVANKRVLNLGAVNEVEYKFL